MIGLRQSYFDLVRASSVLRRRPGAACHLAPMAVCQVVFCDARAWVDRMVLASCEVSSSSWSVPGILVPLMPPPGAHHGRPTKKSVSSWFL